MTPEEAKTIFKDYFRYIQRKGAKELRQDTGKSQFLLFFRSWNCQKKKFWRSGGTWEPMTSAPKAEVMT